MLRAREAAHSQLSLSTCSAGSRRGLCWKSAFNLGFLFSALGDRPEDLSFKLFHTSFSKLPSQGKEAGGGEETVGGGGGEKERPFPSLRTLGAELSPYIICLSSRFLVINPTFASSS